MPQSQSSCAYGICAASQMKNAANSAGTAQRRSRVELSEESFFMIDDLSRRVMRGNIRCR